MNIDWSKAPEGATHYYRNSPQPWRDLSGYTWKYFSHGKWRPGPSVSTSAELMQSTDLFAKPLPQTWTGEGLPPVGIEIEALLPGLGSTTYFWQRAKVVHGALSDSPGEVLVFSLETTRPAWVDKFRPVRTPGQIAEEEKSEAIRDLIALWKIAPDREYNYHYELAEVAYEAGYRKQVEP